MLFNVLKELLKLTEIPTGLIDKIDIFYAVGKLTKEEYNMLLDIMGTTNA